MPTATHQRRRWAKKIRLFGLYLYISNVRLKKRPLRDLEMIGFTRKHYYECKQKLYQRQQGLCPMCGKPYKLEQLENHHCLPVSRFPQLRCSITNMVLLCHNCHKEVHCNPWREIQMITAKAQELGIDLTKYYQNGNNRENISTQH